MPSKNNPWKLPPDDLRLPKDSVHVWRVYLDPAAARLEALKCHLSQDEILRADRFHFAQDRERYIVRHGILRVILGRYLSIDPASLSFRYGPAGKPALERDDISFNLSHSRDLALYAITRNRAVGVDVEHIGPITDAQKIAERFFSPRESEKLGSLSGKEKQALFFRYWTRKEAYLKACGEGLSGSLDQLDASRFPDTIARPVAIQAEGHDGSRWSLMDIVPDPDYSAALAVEGLDFRVEFWEEPAGELRLPMDCLRDG